MKKNVSRIVSRIKKRNAIYLLRQEVESLKKSALTKGEQLSGMFTRCSQLENSYWKARMALWHILHANGGLIAYKPLPKLAAMPRMRIKEDNGSQTVLAYIDNRDQADPKEAGDEV